MINQPAHRRLLVVFHLGISVLISNPNRLVNRIIFKKDQGSKYDIIEYPIMTSSSNDHQLPFFFFTELLSNSDANENVSFYSNCRGSEHLIQVFHARALKKKKKKNIFFPPLRNHVQAVSVNYMCTLPRDGRLPRGGAGGCKGAT